MTIDSTSRMFATELVLGDLRNERTRQIVEKGWTPAHDDEAGLPHLYIRVDELMTEAGVNYQLGNLALAYEFAKKATTIQVAMLESLKRKMKPT